MELSSQRSYSTILSALLLAACGNANQTCPSATPDAKASSSSSAKPVAAASASGAPAAAMMENDNASPVLPPIEIGKAEPAKIGDKTVSAEVCKMDGPIMAGDTFDAIGDIAVAPDGSIYVLDEEGELRKYKAKAGGACELSLDRSFGDKGILLTSKGTRATALSIDDAGTIYVSSSGKRAFKVVNGKIGEKACDEHGVLRVDGSGKTGILGEKKVTIDGGKCEGKDDFKPADWKDKIRVSDVRPFGGDTLVVGSSDDGYKLGLFGADDKQKALVGEKSGDQQMCNFEGATKCNMGICAMDANCRSLRVWGLDGKWVGFGKLGDMAGLSYPWPVGFTMGKDAAYMSWTHGAKDSNDKNAYGVVIRITGLN